MYVCKNSKPQGLEGYLKHELLKTERTLTLGRGSARQAGSTAGWRPALCAPHRPQKGEPEQRDPTKKSIKSHLFASLLGRLKANLLSGSPFPDPPSGGRRSPSFPPTCSNQVSVLVCSAPAAPRGRPRGRELLAASASAQTPRRPGAPGPGHRRSPEVLRPRGSLPRRRVVLSIGLCVYIYIYIYIYMYVCIERERDVRIFTYMHMYVCICMYICIHIYAFT